MNPARASVTPIADGESQSSLLLDSSKYVLAQISSLIEELGDDQYAQSSDGVKPSIGKHVRDVVEFYQSLFSHLAREVEETLCYDDRQREQSIEVSRACALASLLDISTKLDSMPKNDIDLTLASRVHPEKRMIHTSSSVYREMVYLLDHTVHHMALIKYLAEFVGVNLPHEFGVAPSTLVFEAQE